MQFLNVSVATLLRRHPWAQEVLEWYGVDLDDTDHCLSLSALCWLKSMDPDRVAKDLLAANPDTDETTPTELWDLLLHGDQAPALWVDDDTLELDAEPWMLDGEEDFGGPTWR